MNDNIDTKEIERKAYFNYHKDGILDIYLGISMAMFTVSFISPTYSMVWMIALLPVFYRDSKRRYTFPRLGYVKFSEGTSKRSTTLAMALASLSLVGGLLVFFSGFPNNYNWMVPFIENWKLVAAGGLFITLSLFGYVSKINRLYYYGALSLILFGAGAIIPLPGYIVLPTLGGIITLSGIYHLYRFTQEYPLETRQENE
ncbi:MAG: hypothetical protein ACWGQW_20770 [bacterium]